MRLIDADDLIKVFQHKLENNIFPLCVISTIEEAPTIEEELVKHGKWEEIHSPYIQEGAHKRKCTNCGECTINIAEPLSYCPNCGAKMEV